MKKAGGGQKKSICSLVQELLFFYKQFHSSSPYPSHSLHHICTCNSTMWPASNSSPLIICSNPNYVLCLCPTKKKTSVPTISRHFLHPLHCLVPCNFPKTLAMRFSPPYPNPSVHCRFTAAHTVHSLPELTATHGRGKPRMWGCPHTD